MNEPKILKKVIKYNFVPKIIASFQDYDNLYLITNFFEGDTLNKHKKKYLSEEKIKFIVACVIQSLIYLRKEKIINRDIRMKNIIMDKNKYLNIIDFSFAIDYSDKNKKRTNIITNKLEIPPEILNHSLYDYNADYYNLGVIIYYLIFKQFVNLVKRNNNLNEIFVDYKTINNYTVPCIDFLNKLLISDNRKRLGFNNIDELKNHLWFKGFDWQKLEQRKIKSPLEYMENQLKLRRCKKFKISLEKKDIYLKFLKNRDYKILYEKYNFVNSEIVTNILKSFYIKK